MSCNHEWSKECYDVVPSQVCGRCNAFQVEEEHAELVRERDEARANYQWMVNRACDEKLEGYRELAAKCAQLEEERDEARAEVERLRAEAASFLAMARITDEKHDMKCAEVEMLRGVGCMEDGDGPCGVCRKCAYRRGAEAMRLACLGVVERFMDFGSPHPGMIAHKMSALPIPEET